jgi:chromosome segregation ATPase
LQEIDQEISRYVKALGQGKLSIGRLEKEIAGLEADRQLLQARYEDLQREINASVVGDYNAEVLYRTLKDFRTAFTALNSQEKSEALQCVLKSVTVHPGKLELEVFALEEFCPGSQKRSGWLPGQDSNLQHFG